MGSLTVLLFMLWIGVTGSKVVDLQKRIIGGQTCKDNERHYHVKLIYSTGQLLCGGSLIHDEWILTAAHCFEPGMKAVLGLHPEGHRTHVETSLTFRLHASKKTMNRQLHDIMLIKIPSITNIKKPNNIGTINLGDCSNPLHPGDDVQTAGYGSDSVNKAGIRGTNEAQHLQCANFPIEGCKLIHFNTTLGRMAASCSTVPTHQADLSPGDSGGGVVHNNMIYGINTAVRNSTLAHIGPSYTLNICHEMYHNWIINTINTP